MFELNHSMQAHFYERDSNDQQTYLLLLRHALLVLEFLPNHPEAGNSEFQQRLSGANKIVRSNLAKLELLKPRINNRYDEYEKLLPRLPVGSTSSNQGKWISEHLEDQNRDGWHNDPALDGSKKSLQASQDAEMAVKIHRSEVHRKDAAKRFDVQYDYTSKKEKSQHISVGAWQGPKRNLANKRENDLDSLSMLMQQVRLPKDSQATRQNLTQFKENPDNKLSSLGSIIYPKVPLKARRGSPPSSQPQILAEQVDMLQRSRLPYVPPKISASVDPPPVPEKISDVGSSMKNTSTAASATRSRQNSLDTRDYTFVPSAYLENGTPLRTIFVPPDLRHHFLKVAQSNTRQNLETCGFLCGTLVSNALFVSRLVIPEQESTSDTCEMTNESAFFDYCDAEELIVLGWIHTHPTQTCFMSSRDLHTHAAYQAMMAESVAVVCAPSREPS